MLNYIERIFMHGDCQVQFPQANFLVIFERHDMSNFRTSVLTNIKLLLSLHNTVLWPQMALECSRPTRALSSVPLIAPSEIAVPPQPLILLSIHLYNLLFLGEILSDMWCAFFVPLARKMSLLFIILIIFADINWSCRCVCCWCTTRLGWASASASASAIGVNVNNRSTGTDHWNWRCYGCLCGWTITSSRANTLRCRPFIPRSWWSSKMTKIS